MIKFEELKYVNKGKKLEISYWQSIVDGIRVYIKGNESGMDEECLKTAQIVFANWDKYNNLGINHLDNMLKRSCKYHCHSLYFHEFNCGEDAFDTREGFEMIFWESEPNDDRYVNYVVQFSKGSHCDCGLRIFSN
jgi:hypothetical protein